MLKKYYILILLLLFLSCDSDPISLVNTQDCGNEVEHCISPPQGNLFSYSPSSVLINLDPVEEDSIMIIRNITDENIEEEILLEVSNLGFIDSTNIFTGNEYNYEIRYINEFGFSDSFTQIIYHDFPGIEQNGFGLDLVNENAIEMNWIYNLSEHFHKNYDFLNWIITKEKFNIESSEWEPYDEINYISSVNEDNHYSFIDSIDIELHDELRYGLSLFLDGEYSETMPNKVIQIDFPSLESISYIPLNYHTIELTWQISSNFEDNISSVRIYNNRSNGNPVYESLDGGLSGTIVDDLLLYDQSILPGQNIEYTIEWCGISACQNEYYTVKTFPFYDMVYVPSITNFLFNGETVSIEAFYIDVFEITEALYGLPINHVVYDYSVKNNVSLNNARNFCNQRSVFNNLEELYDGNNIDETRLGFRLPYDKEWYAAAAVLYNDSNIEEVFDYTEQVGSGLLSCNYANILNCFNDVQDAGYYNGENPPYQLSTSPYGLYDCNGNLKEWVEKSMNYNDDRDILMGGDFLSPANESLNSSITFVSSNYAHITTGFRTVLPAGPFLESLNE